MNRLRTISIAFALSLAVVAPASGQSFDCRYDKVVPDTTHFSQGQELAESWSPSFIKFSVNEDQIVINRYTGFLGNKIAPSLMDLEIKKIDSNRIMFEIKTEEKSTRSTAYRVTREVLVFKSNGRTHVVTKPGAGFADIGTAYGKCDISNSVGYQSQKSAGPIGVTVVPVAFTLGDLGPFMGNLEYPKKNAKEGSLKFNGGNEVGSCSGKWQRKGNNFGIWYASCDSGLSASGSYQMTGRAKGSGEGVDSKGRQLKLTIGH